MNQPVAIYRHFDRNGELLYIGITTSPGRRWFQHAETSPWARFVTDVTVHWLSGDLERARRVERNAIREERPLFNRARPAGSTDMLVHQLSYLNTGVSGLLRRVRCRSFPQNFCIACGPDVDAWLDSLPLTLSDYALAGR